MSHHEDRRHFEVVIGPQKYSFLEDGFYRARLREVRSEIGKYQQVFIFRFEITEGKEKDCWCNGMINQSANGRRGKLWQLIKAITEKSPEIYDLCNLEDLIGKECFIHIERRANGNAITEYVSLRDFSGIEKRSI